MQPYLDLQPTTSLLSLVPLPQEIKRAAVLGGELSGTVIHTARPLLESWGRSRQLGADPDGSEAMEEAIVESRIVKAARERQEPLWRRAHTIIEDFAATCSQRDFITLLVDPAGVDTQSLGGGAFRQEAKRLRLIEGGVWSEELRGTNAIGTALAEARPIAVHGAAHFARVNEGLVCVAVPIRNPNGEVIAVLDATSWEERAPGLDPSMVLTVARAIEEVLRAHAYANLSGGLELVERLIESAAGAAFLVEAPGRIVRANALGRAFVEQRGTAQVLPTWEELVAAANTSHGLEFELGGSIRDPVRVSVLPIQNGNGGLLALFVVIHDAPRASKHVPVESTGNQAFATILGEDPALQEARERCARLARSNLPIVLLAETGTGKELFARAIHASSTRAAGPYVAMNCGAIQPELLLNELFGHGPGAFTGASRTGRDGIVAAADGGTLFLDEVADLSMDAQVALLRVLEDGSYARIGETHTRKADIRIVAATCRDLRSLVATGEFRQDLFFRIGGACVELPTLRHRNDFDALLDALWSRVRLPDGNTPPQLATSTRERLAAHTWPGNVRELESTLEYAAILAGDAPLVTPEHLPPALADLPHYTLPMPAKGGALDDARRSSLVEALREHGGNVSAAARHLGVARSTVYRLARHYALPIDGAAH